MKPQKGFDSEYGEFLQAYYEPFRNLLHRGRQVHPGRREQLWEYARRWMHYNNAHVFGFPDADRLKERGILARAMAIYMWDCSISHAVDHANYTWCVTSKERCLRIRIPPPQAPGERVKLAGKIATVDDYARSEMCTWMFFKPWTIKPNLLGDLVRLHRQGTGAGSETVQEGAARGEPADRYPPVHAAAGRATAATARVTTALRVLPRRSTRTPSRRASSTDQPAAAMELPGYQLGDLLHEGRALARLARPGSDRWRCRHPRPGR